MLHSASASIYRLLERIRVHSLVKLNKPIPFVYGNRRYVLNPERAAGYHLENSIQKITRMVALIPEHTKVIFDVGANCGLFSAFAQVAHTHAAVYAFEPSPTLVPVVTRNCRGLGVRIHPLAVGESRGRQTLFVNPESQQTNSLIRDAVSVFGREEEIEAIEVDCTSLDAFAAENGIAGVDVLKVDVQGFEGAVFRGATQTLRTVKQVFVESSWLDIESVLTVVPMGFDYGFRYGAVVNYVEGGADILLSRERIKDDASVHRTFEIDEELINRRWS